MRAVSRKLILAAATTLFLAGGAWAQTTAIEGDLKDEDGKPLFGTKKDGRVVVKIERKDIKGNYEVKVTDKKGHYFHAGLPLGMYKVSVVVDGKVVDSVDNVRPRLGDPTAINFDLSVNKKRQADLAKAAESGQLTQEQSREMTGEQKAALEKAMKERAAAMAKNKALNDAFNAGMEALKTKQFDAAVEQFNKAAEMDPKQHVIWAQLAESFMGIAGVKTGQEQTDAMTKGLDAYGKALELKPDDAAYHNNFALALAKAKKFEDAQNELNKAAQLDPPNAGRYYYNLGAVLVNTGQTEPAGAAFKKAIESDPNYADAQYQYGVYLLSKAQVTPDGKVTPPEGTKEAFEKYLQLKPDGPFAEASKGMLSTIGGSVQTKYENPSAPPPAAKKAAPVKKK
jgi:tetratricopeptide (TPR) repeat protein